MKKRYGKWLILGLAENQEGIYPSKQNYLCRCDCGQEVVRRLSSIKHGYSTQCRRCGHKQSTKKHIKYHIVIGNQFGKWKVLEKKAVGSTYYTCKCECGTIKDITSNRLALGETTCCRKCKLNRTILKKIARLQKSLIA